MTFNDRFKPENMQSQYKLHNHLRALRSKDLYLKKKLKKISPDSPEFQKILKELRDIENEFSVLRLTRNFYSSDERPDFRSYYRHIRWTRPIGLIINLLIWGLLLCLGGFNLGITILLGILALVSTSGVLVQINFLQRIKQRILNPVDNLIEGVDKLAQGEFGYEVPLTRKNEIDALILAFNKMSRKLKDDEELKKKYEENRKDLIGNISHDLKTPITSIQGYIELIQACEDQDKIRNYLKIIDTNAIYVNHLIDDLFLMSKLDMQKLEFHCEDLKAADFLQDLLEELALDVREKNFDFDFQIALAPEVHLNLDPKRVHQILRNLLGNSLKYGPESDGAIRVFVTQQENRICISLEDNGPGIPKDKREKIFERFFRMEQSRSKDVNSTGLGLAIARELVQAQGGSIVLDEGEWGGCLFKIFFPAAIQRAGGKI